MEIRFEKQSWFIVQLHMIKKNKQKNKNKRRVPKKVQITISCGLQNFAFKNNNMTIKKYKTDN